VSFADGRYDLMETMAFDPVDGIRLLDLHLERMKASAAALDFEFDRHVARNELQAATFRLKERSRVRLLLSRKGSLAIEVRAARGWPDAVMRIAPATRPVPDDDPRLLHKTTDRACYREALAVGGTYEVVMTDAEGYVTEGCFSSIFVERGANGEGRLVTPPLSRHILPGILRRSLIDLGEAEEGELRLADLGKGFFIGNASRGLVAATLVAPLT
jgi:4-amino-4-deoxychorismate lyase/para-aminobenzoate synthetase/4-amino-4-deoxychorismate lyase